MADAPAAARGGRPRADIDLSVVEALLNHGWTAKRVAEQLKVDPVTVRRRLQAAGSGFRHHLPDGQLLQLVDGVLDLGGQGRATGHRMAQAAVMAHAGVRPPRAQLLEVLKAHDPDANVARQERTLRRRAYNITTPMELWHFDSYEKLHAWGFFVHGCIDGGSNYVVYMTVALNKSAASLLHGFDRAVADFGYPLRVRADMALEAQGIGQRMLDARGAGAYLTGPSTANQRIENHWNYVWGHFAWYWRQVFEALEDLGLLDRHDPADLYSLTQIFREVLQERLTAVARTWNFHTVRPQAGRGITSYVPVQRFEAGQIDFQRATPRELRQRLVDSVAMPDCEAPTAAQLRTLEAANSGAGRRARGPVVRDPLETEGGAARWLRPRGALHPAPHGEVTQQLVLLSEYQAAAGGVPDAAGYFGLPAEPASLAADIATIRQAIALALAGGG